ncbi:UNVERIFIED_CONTAM: hypothetical protein K2H54_050610 [Gekko kuhli]
MLTSHSVLLSPKVCGKVSLLQTFSNPVTSGRLNKTGRHEIIFIGCGTSPEESSIDFRHSARAGVGDAIENSSGASRGFLSEKVALQLQNTPYSQEMNCLWLREFAEFPKPSVKQELEETLAAGIIRPSESAWALPVVLVSKLNGEIQFCVDY